MHAPGSASTINGYEKNKEKKNKIYDKFMMKNIIRQKQFQ
jgi:hypothetical protein